MKVSDDHLHASPATGRGTTLRHLVAQLVSLSLLIMSAAAARTESSEHLKCPFSRDGDRPEKAPAVTFHNDDNTIEARSWWTRDSLFFHVRVLDHHLSTAEAAVRHDTLADGIEILLDPHTHRRSTDEASTLRLVFSPGGDGYGGTLASPDSQWVSMKDVVNGFDWGYTLTAGIAWTMLGVEPAGDTTLACEFVNRDRDGDEQTTSRASWSGLDSAGYRNPAGWGELVLTRSRSVSPGAITLLAVVAMVLGVLFSRFLRKREEKRMVHRLRQAAGMDEGGEP